MVAPADTASENAELQLNEDDSLPWLETDEYDDDRGGAATGRIIGFAAVMLLLLGVIVGGLWWMTNRTGDDEIPADGSTIAAPEGDYKVKPDDAGGKEFAGTGNVAPAVGQGEKREGRLNDGSNTSGADASAGDKASGDKKTGAAQSAKDGKTQPADKPAASGKGVGVQVGAYRTRERAQAGWVELNRQTATLQNVRYRIVKGTADFGTVYRLQAVAGDVAAANALCSKLKSDGLPCQVKP